MRVLLAVLVLSLTRPAWADPAAGRASERRARPAKTVERAPARTAKPPARRARCKKVVTGKGKHRTTTCVYEITVRAGAPKPGVGFVTRGDARAVVGRPKSGDRLKGLSPRLR